MSNHSGTIEADKPPEKWFPLLGFVVVRKTDLLAGAAFLLAISAAAIQVVEYYRGARPLIFHPDTVYVYFDTYANNAVVTRIAGQISFTNTGALGRNAIIRDVAATIGVSAKTIEEHWQSFALVTRVGTVLQVEPKEAAHPLVVEGGNAGSQTVTFSPRVIDCAGRTPCNVNENYASDTDFLGLLHANTKIGMKFVATTFESKLTLESSCDITITDDFIKILAENSWYAASCNSP
jgi:hypothetical protein